MGFTLFPKPEPAPEGHPSQERRTNRDVRLRLHGFRIERRPRKGEPVWSRLKDGRRVEYPQSRALDLIGLEQKGRDDYFATATCEGR